MATKLMLRLGDLQTEAETIAARADTEGRDLTSAERTRLDQIFAQFSDLEGDAARLERIAAGQRSTGRAMRPAIPGEPERSIDASIMAQTRGPGAFIQSLTTGRGRNDGFRSMAEFMTAVGRGVDPRLQIFAAGAEEGTGAGGGFLVPTQFAADILGPVFVSSGILKRVTTLPMTTHSLTVAGLNTQDHSGGAIGGLTLKWGGEGVQLPGQSPVLRAISMVAKKGNVYVEASNELLSDAASASAQLERAFVDAARAGLESAVLIGDGVGKPRGVLNSSALITVSKEGAQAADTILYANIANMLGRLHPSLLADAMWVASPTCLPQLLSLVHVGLAGATAITTTRVEVMNEETPGTFTLQGLPLVFCEALPTLGDVGDLMLVAPSEYLLGMRKDIAVESSPHLKFDYDKTAFRLTVRCDGDGRWNAPVTPQVGSTLSWCVALEAR